jgi:hypothetical protein
MGFCPYFASGGDFSPVCRRAEAKLYIVIYRKLKYNEGGGILNQHTSKSGEEADGEATQVSGNARVFAPESGRRA